MLRTIAGGQRKVPIDVAWEYIRALMRNSLTNAEDDTVKIIRQYERDSTYVLGAIVVSSNPTKSRFASIGRVCGRMLEELINIPDCYPTTFIESRK